MKVVFIYLFPNAWVPRSVPIDWISEDLRTHSHGLHAQELIHKMYGHENVRTEIYHPHIHGNKVGNYNP